MWTSFTSHEQMYHNHPFLSTTKPLFTVISHMQLFQIRAGRFCILNYKTITIVPDLPTWVWCGYQSDWSVFSTARQEGRCFAWFGSTFPLAQKQTCTQTHTDTHMKKMPFFLTSLVGCDYKIIWRVRKKRHIARCHNLVRSRTDGLLCLEGQHGLF